VRRTAAGAVLVVAAVVCAGVLTFRGDVFNTAGGIVQGSIYPVAAWVFVAVLGLSGVAVLLGAAVPGAGVGALAALQLSGTGIVAVKHWRPAMGMGGSYEHLAALQAAAALLALVGLVCVAVCLGLLVQTEAVPVQPSPRVLLSSLVIGALLVVAVPVLVGHYDPETMDLNSLGAFALMYGLPWGAAVIVSAWLPRSAALAVLVAVLGSTVLVAATTPMADIVFTSVGTAFVPATMAVASLVALRVLSGQGRVRTAQPGC
jgi:hypothetical protein